MFPLEHDDFSSLSGPFSSLSDTSWSRDGELEERNCLFEIMLLAASTFVSCTDDEVEFSLRVGDEGPGSSLSKFSFVLPEEKFPSRLMQFYLRCIQGFVLGLAGEYIRNYSTKNIDSTLRQHVLCTVL